MKHETKHKVAAAVGMAMIGSAAIVSPIANAIDVTPSVTVKNAITLTLDSELSFGTIRANYNNGSTVATLNLSANPATATVVAQGNSGSTINEIVKGAPAQLSIADAGPFSSIFIQMPATDISLTAAVGGGAPAEFSIPADTWKLRKTSGTAADLTFTAANDQATIQVDGAGAATFTVGATLSTDPAVTGGKDNYVLDETTYEGTFAVTVSY